MTLSACSKLSTPYYRNMAVTLIRYDIAIPLINFGFFLPFGRGPIQSHIASYNISTRLVVVTHFPNWNGPKHDHSNNNMNDRLTDRPRVRMIIIEINNKRSRFLEQMREQHIAAPQHK